MHDRSYCKRSCKSAPGLLVPKFSIERRDSDLISILPLRAFRFLFLKCVILPKFRKNISFKHLSFLRLPNKLVLSKLCRENFKIIYFLAS